MRNLTIKTNRLTEILHIFPDWVCRERRLGILLKEAASAAASERGLSGGHGGEQEGAVHQPAHVQLRQDRHEEVRGAARVRFTGGQLPAHQDTG